MLRHFYEKNSQSGRFLGLPLQAGIGQEVTVVVGMCPAGGEWGACLSDGPRQISADELRWHLPSGSSKALREWWAFFLAGSVSVWLSWDADLILGPAPIWFVEPGVEQPCPSIVEMAMFVLPALFLLFSRFFPHFLGPQFLYDIHLF